MSRNEFTLLKTSQEEGCVLKIVGGVGGGEKRHLIYQYFTSASNQETIHRVFKNYSIVVCTKRLKAYGLI